MKFFFSYLFERKQTNHHDDHAAVAVDESLHNITEGSEFLDDAIRMKEQPFMYAYAEENLPPGSLKDL
jgi:hypothetical protein